MSLIDGSLHFIALPGTEIDQSFPAAQFTYTGYKKPRCLLITSKRGDT